MSDAGRQPRGFDFTGQMRRLCEDVSQRLPELTHVQMPQVAVSFSQARSRVLHGLQAKLTPLRFEDGSMETTRRGRRYVVQRLYDAGGREMLYILSFYLPRFMDQPLSEKLITIFHELWHISPHFDGDLRRHPGRCYAHTHSQKEYDAFSAALADKWLRLSPPRELHEFLDCSFADLKRRYGPIYGQKIPTPKLLLSPTGGLWPFSKSG